MNIEHKETSPPLHEVYSAEMLSGLIDEKCPTSTYILLGILFQLEKIATASTNRVSQNRDLFNNARSR